MRLDGQEERQSEGGEQETGSEWPARSGLGLLGQYKQWQQKQQEQLKQQEQKERQPVPEQEGSMESLTQKLEAEQSKSEEYLDMLRRTQADFVNYRRRTSQEQNEGRIAGQIAVLEQILPVLDDFERAVEATPKQLANQSWTQGIHLIARRLSSTLEQMGVQKIGRPGEQFDPRQHEAIMQEARPGVPAGRILQIARPGYALGDRIIRPAQVIVAGE